MIDIFSTFKSHSFGNLIKRLRLMQPGLTQIKLAAQIGVNNTYISRMEAGIDAPPTEEILIKMAKVLNVDPYDLILAAGRTPEDFHRVLVSNVEVRDYVKAAASKMAKNRNRIME